MTRQLTAAALLCVFTATAVLAQAPLTWRKVDFFEVTGEDEKKRDARLVLDPVARTIVLSHEDDGAERELYAEIPYDAVTGVIYELSQHRRYGAGLLVNPFLLFSRGKKHWLTLEFKGVEAMPQGFVYTQLDKNNYRQILSALRAGLDVEVQEFHRGLERRTTTTNPRTRTSAPPASSSTAHVTPATLPERVGEVT